MSGHKLGLAAEQRALLALLKDRPVGDALAEPPPDARAKRPDSGAYDPYVEQVRRSRGLAMLRTITAGWRRFDLERHAPLTARALSYTGRFEEELLRLGRDPGTPSAVDALGIHFVERYVADDDPLVSAVARTERALIRIARGDRSRHEIAWEYDPAAVLNALLAGRSPDAAATGSYRVVVSQDIRGLIEVQALG